MIRDTARWLTVLVVAAAACKNSPTGAGSGGTVDHVAITPASATVLVGDSVGLAAEGLTSAGMVVAGTPTWSSDAPSVATVSATGEVVGVAEGSATVTASIGGKSATAVITVVTYPATRIVISPATATIEVGAAAVLSDTVYDGLGHILDRSVTWTSSNPSVATVSPLGVVVGLLEGQVVITATREGIIGSATVSVTRPAVATLTLSPHLDTLVPPQSLQLQVDLADARGVPLLDRTVSYQTRDPYVADVSDKGVVLAKTPGTTEIVATSEGVSDSVTLVVTPPPPDGLEIIVTNHLYYPIQISVNGSYKGFAPAGGPLALISDSLPLLKISWTMLSPPSQQNPNQTIGEIVADTLPSVTNAGGVLNFDVTSQLSDGRRIFVPILQNTTGTTMQLDIPLRLTAQPCNCILIDDGAAHDQYGYWVLQAGSTVNAYGRGDAAHTGPHVDAPVMAADVDPITGVWQYTFTVGP
jgi:Bacterial Ig-like domain (group 2)